jgi:hypothetical protein
MAELSKEQKENIRKYIESFRKRLKSELSNKGWRKERKDRIGLFQRLLNKNKLKSLTEKEFAKIIESLWASQIWGNKDYLVEKILNDNGLPKIRTELIELLYGKDSLDKRFDRFKQNIKGLGPSSITEILVFVFPDKYCLWNEKPKNVLPLLGMENLLPDRVFKYSINGKDYVNCNNTLVLVKEELKKNGFGKVDFLDVDIFMWLLFSEVVKKREKVKKEVIITKIPKEIKIDVSSLTHWDVMAVLIELGNLLGFDTYTADPARKSKLLDKTLGEISLLKGIPAFTYQRYLDTVKNVDVIWFKDEFPAYCFEVEHTTGVSLGLLRLYQIRNFTNAKFYVIAPSNIISKFQTETTKDPFYRIKNRYNFKSYEELVMFHEEAKKYHEIQRRFLGKEFEG